MLQCSDKGRVCRVQDDEYVLWKHERGIKFFMVDSRECMVEVHGAVVHRYVDGGSFGEWALINDNPRAASSRVTSKTLVCVCMKQIMIYRIKLLQQVKVLWSFNYHKLREAAQALELCRFTRVTAW